MDTPGIPSVSGATHTQAVPSAHAGTTATSRVAAPVDKPAEALPQESPKPVRDPRSLAFHVEGQRIVTTIVDAESNTVIAQIPDADVIRLAAEIDRLRGFFLHDKA